MGDKLYQRNYRIERMYKSFQDPEKLILRHIGLRRAIADSKLFLDALIYHYIMLIEEGVIPESD
jgi:hypothetical protein